MSRSSRPLAGQEYSQGGGVGKPLSPAHRREAVGHVVTVLHVFERLGVSDGTLADPLQYDPSAQEPRGPATGSRNDPACELITHMVGGTITLGWSHLYASH